MQTWNGNYAPTNQDFWNPVGDMQKQAINNNRPIPVYSKAERDGLATLAPDNVIPAGTMVIRMDRNGATDVFVDGEWVEGDSEWVNMAYESGYSAGTPGQLAYKIAGNTLHIKGGATGAFAPFNYVRVSPNLIPPQFRPPQTQYFGTVGTGGIQAGIQVSSNGYIQLVSSAEPAWISACVTMPLN